MKYCLFATLLTKWYELSLESTRIQVTINYDNDDICLIKVFQSLLTKLTDIIWKVYEQNYSALSRQQNWVGR